MGPAVPSPAWKGGVQTRPNGSTGPRRAAEPRARLGLLTPRLPMPRLALLAALLVAGCADPAATDTVVPDADLVEVGDADDGASAENPDAVETQRAGEGRTEMVLREVSVEGEAEERTFRLVAFPDFPVPFSSYVPDDASVEQPGSGDAVSITWGDAEILVNVALGETPDEALARLVAQVPEGMPTEKVDSAWASDAFSHVVATQGPSYFITTYVGEHDGTTFVVETTSTFERMEGFEPTAGLFFDEWQWADGSAL